MKMKQIPPKVIIVGENLTQWHCFGTSSLYCPNDTKAKYIIDNHSLD